MTVINLKDKKMTHSEDLLRLKEHRIEAMGNEIDKLKKRIDFLEAVLEVGQQVTFNN